MAALLRALDDPSDMTSLVAGLKSEAFSCSDEELLRYKVKGGAFTVFAPAIEGDPVSDALSKLRGLYEAKSNLAMPAFVDRVIRESFLVEALLLSAAEQQRAANLKLISQRARDFSDKGMDSLRPFIRWVSSRQYQRVRESESQMAENEDDVVRVMTIHGAKGLEFPVVFLAGMEEGLLPHIRSLDDPAQLEEERRIAYVGMTRAQDRLYLLHADSRFHQGARRRSVPSRFLADIPQAELVRPVAAAEAPALTARERRAALAERLAEQDESLMPTFAAGDRVLHTKFGRGVVVSCKLVPGDQQVTVAFEGEGVKKLLLSFAPLTSEGEAGMPPA